MNARVSGPISGGAHGWPMAASLLNLEAYGYVEEEFFFEGVAPTFRATDERPSPDGRWGAIEGEGIPFKTRLLVRRPRDPSRFNGTVLVSWLNVSVGSDALQLDTPGIFAGGFAVAAVSAQAVGVHGFNGPDPRGLTAWDPQRYGSLSIPADDASYGIFTIAGRVVGPERRRDVPDPLDGLEVERLVATGASQSAARLHTYLNAIQPREKMFDAFLLDVHFGSGSPLSTDRAQRESNLGDAPLFRHFSQLRDDLGIPVMVLNTESEAVAYYPVRQPETPTFRLWETAGAAHTSVRSMLQVQRKTEREWGSDVPPASDLGGISPNTFDMSPIRDAALDHLQRWMSEGVPPPIAPRFVVTGEPPAIERDADGMARGGIRLPAVAVPVATLRGGNDGGDLLAGLLGACLPFSPEQLGARYVTRERYVDAVADAAAASVEAGFLLAADAARIVDEARSAHFPANV
jgi:hypothetical protein